MQLKPGLFLAPCAVIALFILSFRFWLTTTRDREFAWAFLIFSVLAAATEFALYAWSTDNRLKELEWKVERLTERLLSDSPSNET